MNETTSTARIEANRANAQHSTGPVTTAGRTRSSRNSLTHGMTSTAILLRDEDENAYQSLVESTIADLAPEGERERSLAVNVANGIWRRERMYRIEAATWKLAAAKVRTNHPEIASDLEARAFIMLSEVESRSIRLLSRYLKDAERAAERAAKEYREALADRPEPPKESSADAITDQQQSTEQPQRAVECATKPESRPMTLDDFDIEEGSITDEDIQNFTEYIGQFIGVKGNPAHAITSRP